MSIRVRCTRENASEAFEEMLERTYEAILRCTGANSDPRQKSAAVIAEETQAFVETAMRIVNDRIDSWSRRPKARLFTLPQYLLSKSSQFLVIDPTEGNSFCASSAVDSADGHYSLHQSCNRQTNTRKRVCCFRRAK